MKLKIHDQNLQLVWDCLSTGGHSEVWLHGDGNVFPVYTFDPQNAQNQDHSQNHSKNYNSGHEEYAKDGKRRRNDVNESKTTSRH